MRNLPSFLPRHKIAEQLGVSNSTIKRKEKISSFPKTGMSKFGKDYFNFEEIIQWMKSSSNKGEQQ